MPLSSYPGGNPAGRIAETITVRAALPPIRRAAIAEIYYAGRTIAETAKALGILPGTVKSRACHALTALRSARPQPHVRTAQSPAKGPPR